MSFERTSPFEHTLLCQHSTEARASVVVAAMASSSITEPRSLAAQMEDEKEEEKPTSLAASLPMDVVNNILAMSRTMAISPSPSCRAYMQAVFNLWKPMPIGWTRNVIPGYKNLDGKPRLYTVRGGKSGDDDDDARVRGVVCHRETCLQGSEPRQLFTIRGSMSWRIVDSKVRSTVWALDRKVCTRCGGRAMMPP